MKSASFKGFSVPRFVQVPDELIDVLMPDLSGAELRVLLYVCRRTYGFHRETAEISLQQMLKGVSTKGGKTLDRGTGIKRRATLVDTLRQLRLKGYLVSTGGKGPVHASFRLRFQGDTPDLQMYGNRTPKEKLIGTETAPIIGTETAPIKASINIKTVRNTEFPEAKASGPENVHLRAPKESSSEGSGKVRKVGDGGKVEKVGKVRKASWLDRFNEAHVRICGGNFNYGQAGAALKSLREHLGDEELYRRWSYYLETTPLKGITVSWFAQKVNAYQPPSGWKPTGRNRHAVAAGAAQDSGPCRTFEELGQRYAHRNTGGVNGLGG